MPKARHNTRLTLPSRIGAWAPKQKVAIELAVERPIPGLSLIHISLQSVLFPGGRLPLRIFEQRYMDMAKVCLKHSSSFGICLIARGEEVARAGRKAAEPHAVGTLAHIADWDMQQLGVLNIIAQGGERFRLLRHWTEDSGLLCGEIELIATPPALPVPGPYARLVPLRCV